MGRVRIGFAAAIMACSGCAAHTFPATYYLALGDSLSQGVQPDAAFRSAPFPRWWGAEDLIRVEEYREDGTLVIRADLPGIDPDTDVELTVSDGVLRIEAERREEEKKEGKGYVRQELRYGSLSRSLPLPEGVTEADIAATYKDGVLEIRVPEPKRGPAKKIAISKP
jgi:HSP20 family protein